MDEYDEFLYEVVYHIVKTGNDPKWVDHPAKLSCGIYTDKHCLISIAVIFYLRKLNEVSYAQGHIYDMFCSGQSILSDRTFLYVNRAILNSEDLKYAKISFNSKNEYRIRQMKHMNQQLYNDLYDMAQDTTDISKQRLFATAGGLTARAQLAINRSLAVDVQHLLAKDKSKNVREYLASNPVLADDVQMLLIDEFPWIQNPGPKTKSYLQMKKVLDK